MSRGYLMKKANTIIPVWKIIAGFGSHIKATRDNLIILYQGKTQEIPLTNLDHLMIVGGHNIQTSAITMLLNKGIFISFFESDGEPSGYLKPYGYSLDEDIQCQWDKTPSYQYALTFAKAAAKERILAIEQWNEEIPGGILYSGELDILDKAIRELDSLIKIEEINRIDRLIGDMYYEIFSRLVNPEFAFKRRTERPYLDPINAVLSFGYAMINAKCTQSLVGVHLDPDKGMLHRGKRSLCLDLSNCWKTRMVDSVALDMIQTGIIRPEAYEISEKRCILRDTLITKIIDVFQASIRDDIIDTQVKTLLGAIYGENPFILHRI